MKATDFKSQVDLDQKRYSRYVCDSRAIPNAIDGLKPVQRRILWTMWNSKARNAFVKTVKVAGMTMAYHPHGNASIEEAIAGLVQRFAFANNYPLISGEGTFGDVLAPKAIASPRYTEVKLSDFAKDLGLFESLPDLDYALNYDETEKEPIFYCPKVPLVLLNPISGIATGFRCSLVGHRLSVVVRALVHKLLKKEKVFLTPWHRGFKGSETFEENELGQAVHSTGFGFETQAKTVFLTNAPKNWNREKTIAYLEKIRSEAPELLRDYLDHSKDTFKIELIPKRGVRLTPKKLQTLFSKTNQEIISSYVITPEGRLENQNHEALLSAFLVFRRKHLMRRFTRLKKIEAEKMLRLSELIRFIKEKWNKKVPLFKGKSDFQAQLKQAEFAYFEWLSEIPLYRLTIEESLKAKAAIKTAKKQHQLYDQLSAGHQRLRRFMIEELTALAQKWDSPSV